MTRSIYRLLTAVLLTTSLITLLSCGRKSVKDTDIVATWGDTALTVAQFKDWMYVRHRNEAQAMKQPYEDRISILDEYVLRDCKLLEGRRLGLDKREDIAKEYDNAVQQKAVELLYNEKVRDRVFTEEMIRDYFDHDSEELRVRHLLIQMPDSLRGRDTVAAWTKINDIYAKVKAGQDFIKLIDQFNEDQTVDPKLHGDLGFFRWGKMVDEFEAAAWKLKPGEISPIVKTRYGYHIIQLIERRPINLEYNTSHILVKVNRKDTPAETTLAFERAKMIMGELKKSGADFAAIARKYSEDEKSWVNGEIGWIPKGTMPTEYWDKVYTMKEGEIAGPVHTYKGYHIIRLNDKRLAPRSIDRQEDRDGAIAGLSRLYRDKMQEVAQDYMDSVKMAFNMEYDEGVIKMLLRKLGDPSAPQNMNLFSSLTPEEREMLVVRDKLGGMKVQELVDMYGDHRFPPQYRNDPSFIKEMCDPQVTPRYLAEYAKAEGYYDRPICIKEGKRALDNQLLPAVEKEMVYNKGNPTDEELKKYFDANIQKYTNPERRTGFEILVDDKTLANDLLSRIKKGEDISSLARRYTMRTKVKGFGGKLTDFVKDEYGPVSQKAFTMSVGELTGPIDVDGKTWSIFKLTGVTPSKTQSFEEARKQLESEVRFQNQKNLKDQWIVDLKKAYDIKYYENVIKAVWPVVESLPQSEEKARKALKADREEQAKRKIAEDRIKLKLQPGSTQEFTTKEGKKVQVQIGQPRYVDKEGKEIPQDKSNIRLTPGGKIEGKDSKQMNIQPGAAPVVKLKPVSPPPTQSGGK